MEKQSPMGSECRPGHPVKMGRLIQCAGAGVAGGAHFEAMGLGAPIHNLRHAWSLRSKRRGHNVRSALRLLFKGTGGGVPKEGIGRDVLPLVGVCAAQWDFCGGTRPRHQRGRGAIFSGALGCLQVTARRGPVGTEAILPRRAGQRPGGHPGRRSRSAST